MSISSEISRISSNISASLAAVANKGVTVPSGSTSDDLAGLIAQITGSGTGAISVVDTLDSHGGTIRTITGVDISDTTAVASDVAQGKYFYTANGTKTTGTGTLGTDCPTFTVVYNSTGTEVTSITCNKTYAQCVNYFNNDKREAIVTWTINNVTESCSISATSYVSNTLQYMMLYNDVVVQLLIMYQSDGTLTGIVDPFPRKTASDLTVSGGTVTVPFGVYYDDATKSVASGSVTAPSSISGTSATVTTGTNTLTLTKTISVTPNVTIAGYISSGTAGNSSVSLTASVNTLSSSDLTASGDTVTVPAGYYASQATKAVSAGSATAPASISGTSATVSTGTNTLTLTKTVSVTPSVPAGYVSSGTAGNSSVSLTASVNTRSSSDLTASGDTVTVPAGYYSSQATKAVTAGTAGTPTATKGTVSNNSISVTSSVTNTSGYITGSTKTGTAVTVAASELVSGNLEITQNGTDIDVTNYATVSVSVSGGGAQRKTIIPEQTVTASGNYNEVTFLEPLVEGDSYIMTVNGTEATGTAQTVYGGLYLWYGNMSNNNPCFEYVANTNKMYWDTLDSSLYGTYTLKVEQEISNRTTIVPEQTITVSSNYTYITMISPLVTGETYYYTVNGVETTETAWSDYGSPAIGSESSARGETLYANGAMVFAVAGSSQYGTYTIKVEQDSGGGGGSTLITKTITENGTYNAEDDDADGYSSVTVNIPAGTSKNIQYSVGRYEVSNTAYTATDLTVTVSKAGSYKCYWVMDRNTTSGTSGSQLYKNGSAVGSAHASWTYNGNNRNGMNCEETLTFAADDVLVVRARSRNTSYICGVSNLFIVEQ